MKIQVTIVHAPSMRPPQEVVDDSVSKLLTMAGWRHTPTASEVEVDFEESAECPVGEIWLRPYPQPVVTSEPPKYLP